MNAPAVSHSHSRYRLWSLLALLAIILMDGSLASLWYRAIVPFEGVPWGGVLLVMLGVLLGSLALAAFTARLNWPLGVRQAVFLGWICAVLLGSMKVLLYAQTPATLWEMVSGPIRFITLSDSSQASFVHVLFVFVLIWRGVVLARGPSSLHSVNLSFQMGLLGLLLYGMFFAQRYPAASSTGLYLYLFSALIALSATRILSLTDMRGGRVPALNMAWMTSTFGSALLVVGIAVLFGWASSGQLVATAIRVVVTLLSVVAAAITLLLEPVARLFWSVFPGIMETINALFGRLSGMRLPKFLEAFVIDLSAVISQVIPGVILGRKLFLFALLLVILVAVLLGLRLLSRLRPGEMAEESANLDRAGLKDLLRRLGLGPRGAWRGRRYSARQLLAAARIRQVYSHLMSLSQQLGAARPPAATPLEFLPQLQRLFSEEPDSVQEITQAYVKIRYGEYPEDRREVEAVMAAWERVKKQGRALARRKL